MNSLELLFLAFAAFVLLHPVRRNVVGVFGSIGGSESKTTNNTSVDRSQIGARDQGIAVGKQGLAAFNTTTLDEGATQFKVQGKGARLVIQPPSTDSALLKGVLDTQAKTLEQVLAGQAASGAASATTLESVLSRISDLAENRQTGGESGRDKTILYIVIAAIAGLAVMFGKRAGLWIVGLGAVAWFVFGRKAPK